MRTRTVVCCKPVLQMQVCENKYRTSPPLSEHKAQQCMDDVPPRQSLIETAQFNSVLDQLPVVCVCWFSFSVFCILLNPRRGVIHFHYVPTVGKGGAVFWDIYWDREGERDIGATQKMLNNYIQWFLIELWWIFEFVGAIGSITWLRIKRACMTYQRSTVRRHVHQRKTQNLDTNHVHGCLIACTVQTANCWTKVIWRVHFDDGRRLLMYVR